MSEQRQRALIVDMDGTLCDVRTIRHLVDRSRGTRRDFDAFHSLSIDCPAHSSVLAAVRRARDSGLETIIVSAREERWGVLTALWLREKHVEYVDMFLRANGDPRPDMVVKREIAERIIKRYEPVVAIDDRPELISVWQEFGISTRLVSPGGHVGRLLVAHTNRSADAQRTPL